MPGLMVHVGATVLCAHAGQAQPTVTMSAPWVVAGCTLPPQAGGPCVSAQWTTAATRVTANGVPLLLLDSQAVCAPTGTPLTVLQTQTRVSAQ